MPQHSYSHGRRKVLALASFATLALAASHPVLAQEPYPTKPIRIVIPYAAGGAGDAVTRIVAQRLSARLGQQVITENRPGAGGATGAAYAARSPADGYTLAFAAIGYNLLNAMQPNLQFDPSKELMPIGLIVTQPYVLVSRPDAPYKTAPELLAHAKPRPTEVKLAHAGVGTLIHLFGTWMGSENGGKFNEIPYTGSAPALNSVLAGQTDIYYCPPSICIPHINDNKLRALATTGSARMAALPNVPTLKELGIPISGATWFGLMAPAGTPRPIIERINKELNATLAEPEVKQRLEAMQFTVEPTTPEAFGKFFNEQTATWTRIIKDNNVRPQ